MRKSARSSKYDHEQWKNAYFTAVRCLPKKRYTGEDIREIVEPVIGTPHHPNCWGGAFNSVLWTSNLFRPLLRYTAMRSPRSHGRRTRIYTKVR